MRMMLDGHSRAEGVLPGGGGALSAASVERLAHHELFDFALPRDTAAAVRVRELAGLLAQGPRVGLVPALDERIHDLEDELHAAGSDGLYLLAALQHFRQQLAMYVDVDEEERLLAHGGMAVNMFARANRATTTKAPGASLATAPAPAVATAAAATMPTTTAITKALATNTPMKRTHHEMTTPIAIAPAPPRAVPTSSAPTTPERPAGVRSTGATPRRQHHKNPRSLSSPTTTTTTTMIITTTTTTSPSTHRKRDRAHAAVRDGPMVVLDDDDETKERDDIDDEVVCGVCLQPDSHDHDPIVLCELCNCAVHQSCYRIEDIPEEDWYCHPCSRYLRARDVENNVTPTYELECAACQQKGGAFIATIDGQWVHMACSMFLPELYVLAHRVGDEEVIGGIDQLRARRRLRCIFCKKKDKGACAQCVVGKCTTSYHVLCALRKGIRFTFEEEKDQFGSGCPRHQKQFMGVEYVEPASRKTKRMTSRPITPPRRSQHSVKEATPKRAKRRRSSVSSDSSEDDGVVLDEESDDSRALSSDSDVEFELVTAPQSTSAASPRQRRNPIIKTSPATTTTKKRTPPRQKPPMKQQTLHAVPTFGIVKEVVKPALPPALQLPPVQGIEQQATLLPSPPVIPDTGAAKPPIPKPISVTHAKSLTKTQLLVPVGGSSVNGTFDTVLVIIPCQPLGMSLHAEAKIPSSKIVVHAAKSTNAIVIDAFSRGILQDGDEFFRVNDVALRNRNVASLQDVLSSIAPPYHCWIRTRTKRKVSLLSPSEPSVVAPTQTSQPPTSDVPSQPQVEQSVPTPAPPTEGDKSKSAASQPERTPFDEATGTDWPWLYLRSDGKLAMNLLWRSLDAGFFRPKMDGATWRELLGKVERIIGYRLSPDHPEYRELEQLTHIPDRENPLPECLVEYRNNQKNKKKRSLATDTVFVGVNIEADCDWDSLPPLSVGKTVVVAKRTWPGINKLGGAGRIKKVHEKRSEDGTVTSYLYDVAYVLGGSEKRVERRWISEVDLDKDDQSGKDKSQTSEEADSENLSAEENQEQTCRLRIGLRVVKEDKDVELPQLTTVPQALVVMDKPKLHLRVSTSKTSVHLERMMTNVPAGQKDLLWHLHFPLKQSSEDVLLSDALNGEMMYMEEQPGEEDAADSDDEGNNEIKKQLVDLQAQFQAVMGRNNRLFASLKSALEGDYKSKAYRQKRVDLIRSQHFEGMYRELMEAKREFEDSDEESDDEDTALSHTRRKTGSKGVLGGGRRAKDGDVAMQESCDSDSELDDSCGGIFINKIKQEGNEVCVLCELTGGDFAATSCGRVVHPQCAMYTPETYFTDGIVHGIDKIPEEERRALTCAICHRKNGLSKIQCGHQRCVTAFHVACAYVNGFLTKDPHYLAWCPKHLKSSGMADLIELPPHLRRQQNAETSSPARRQRTSSGTMTSSVSSKRKKRRRTADEHDKMNGAGDRIDEEEPCARRLIVDSDDADAREEKEEPGQVFSVGDTVTVQAREWRGSNKPGGVARVTAVHPRQVDGASVVTYDVAYVMDHSKEKQVESRYVRAYSPESKDGVGTGRIGKKH